MCSKWVAIGIFLFFVDVSGIKSSPLLSSTALLEVESSTNPLLPDETKILAVEVIVIPVAKTPSDQPEENFCFWQHLSDLPNLSSLLYQIHPP